MGLAGAAIREGACRAGGSEKNANVGQEGEGSFHCRRHGG